MKKFLPLNSMQLALLFGGVLLFGAIISAILTTDLRWMNWHFSRLGEGSHFSAKIFNFALLISSIILFRLGLNLRNNIQRINYVSSKITIKAAKIVYRAFIAASVCLMSVAIFPYDRFQLIHDISGYSLLFIFIYLCTFTEKILPIYSKRFYLYCNLVLLTIIFFYILFFGFELVTLLFVESVVFTLLYIWLLKFIKNIQIAIV